MESMNQMGVLLPTRGVLVYAKGGRPRVELNWQMAETAERIGYDSVWVGDSITSKPRLEPMAVMAALAARTHRVKIGTAVMLNALRHPVHLAHSIATIDNISGGRIVLGLGAGRSNNQMFVDEHAIVGVPITERADRMEESIDVLRMLWSQDNVSHPEGYYPLNDVTLEPRPIQEQVPIWLSSNWVQRGLKRVAAQGDGWITNVPSTEMFTECLDKIEEKGAELGKDVSGIKRALYISVNLNDEDKAVSEGDGFMRAYYGIPYEVVSKQLLCVFGPAQKAIDAIKRYKEVGADYFIVRFASPNQMEQLEKFTESVAPHV